MASLPFQAKLGVPLRKDTVHHASDSANVNRPRYRIMRNIEISDAVLGQEPWGRVKKKVICGIRGIKVASVATLFGSSVV